MLDSLQGQTALVTGAAQRLGRAISLALAEAGVNVVIHYHRSADEAEALRRELEVLGVGAWTVVADLGRPEEYQTLVTRALAAAGTLDILVNNASIFPRATLADVSWNDLLASLEVNAWAPFVLSREFHQHVGHGAIINLLDTRVQGYDWAHVAYILSKHALAVLTRMTALEYAPAIRVNAVAPGLILPPPGQDESYLQRLHDTVPLKRHGSAADIAAAVRFLLQSDFVTGQVLFVDGGRHLKENPGGSNSH